MAEIAAIAELVSWLTNHSQHPWTRNCSYEDAAIRVLEKMVELKIIEGRHHPLTLSRCHTVFRVGDELFGRTDGVDQSLFDQSK